MIRKIGLFLIFCFFSVFLQSAQAAEPMERILKVRITWDAYPDAVMYELTIMKGNAFKQEKIVTTRDKIFAAGYEFDTSVFNVRGDNLHWSVRPLDIHGEPMAPYSKPKPLTAAEINPQRPLATTQFDRLPFAKVYPVYSWIPYLKASEYELQVFYDSDSNAETPDKLVKTQIVMGQRSFDYYDDGPYLEEGTYWWRVRAKNAASQAISDWSEPQRFTVVHRGVDIAALGDSITHGGGSVTVPPGYTMYDWQTYTGLPVLNLGFSGNTVEHMVGRFNRDVLPFQPKILVIMGGINNIRLGDKGEQVVGELNKLKFKCLINRITPVFVTVAPINPKAMRDISGLNAAHGWEGEQRKINDWIKKQSYHIDITPHLTDEHGWLNAQLAVDGLHPGVEGKKIIGQSIGQYLKSKFKTSVLKNYGE